MLYHVCDKFSRSSLILLIVMVILRFYFIISEQVFFFFLGQSSHKSTHFQPFCKLLYYLLFSKVDQTFKFLHFVNETALELRGMAGVIVDARSCGGLSGPVLLRFWGRGTRF